MPTHILIVDDEPATNAFLADYFSQLGYDVASAYDGTEAWEQMHVQPPELVLVDIMMPDMGGWELVRRIRADSHFQHISIIVCTARKEGHPSGDLVQGIVYKPFRLEDIAQQVSAALARLGSSGQ